LAKTSFTHISDLIEHEEVHEKKIRGFIKVESGKVLIKPIAVDKKTRLVLDGHSRLNALKELGCTKAPVIYVDFESNSIKVEAWRNSEKVTKADVLNAGLSKKKLPPKTSKIMIKIGGKISHISTIEKIIKIPLSELMTNNS